MVSEVAETAIQMFGFGTVYMSKSTGHMTTKYSYKSDVIICILNIATVTMSSNLVT